MPSRITPNREFAFTLYDVARLLRTYADQRAAEFGITRAQWAVMARLDRQEGIKQSELAETLDLQPITLTRLLDRLEESGLIERRADPHDRRANRLYLAGAARPLLERLTSLGEELMATALAGIDRATVKLILANLMLAKENLRGAIARRSAAPLPLPSLPRKRGRVRVGDRSASNVAEKVAEKTHV
ncbi:MAG TPA: MarR family transcriptional regulator [Xanthobacteraceae bacterium]|jgi:MarR family transcriptional regulator for hemolysin|nr:MarR family transcriptional regulator [Xanthobacteraceae bacterium]